MHAILLSSSDEKLFTGLWRWLQLLKLINNSSSLNKQNNHKRDIGLETQS